MRADGNRIIQVLVNLIDNALRHAPDGSEIELGCRQDGRDVSFWVAGQGPGIPPEHSSRVFDRFYRIDTGRVRDESGAGLDLAISKMIVEAHGGTIRFEMTDSGWTRVVCTLPVR